MFVGVVGIAAFVFLQARNVDTRATSTRDALPVDPIVREAMLLHNSIPALQAAQLPPGTPIGFVNPVPRARFDLTTGAPTRPEDVINRHSYFPLEAAMRGYKELNLRALKMLRPGGVLVTCSCSYHVTETSFLDVLAAAAVDAHRTVRILEVRGQAKDHPILLNVPETAYLKCVIASVR